MLNCEQGEGGFRCGQAGAVHAGCECCKDAVGMAGGAELHALHAPVFFFWLPT